MSWCKNIKMIANEILESAYEYEVLLHKSKKVQNKLRKQELTKMLNNAEYYKDQIKKELKLIEDES